MTPLEDAIQRRDERAAIAALHQDSSQSGVTTEIGVSPLMLALYYEQPEVARSLIDAGADVNLRAANAAGVAPIHAACARQNLAMLRMLLEHGADPELAQEGGFTPMDVARQSGNLVMEKLLLASGA